MITYLSQILPKDVLAKARSLLGFRAFVKTYSGQVRGSGKSLTLTYMGNGANLSLVASAIFSRVSSERALGAYNIWNASTACDRYLASDIVLIDVPWPYDLEFDEGYYMIETPAWVRQEIPIASTWERTKANFRKNVRGSQMRKIRKNALSYTTTNRNVAVNDFYRRMYIPHTRRRFGDTADVESLASVRSAIKNGTLLQVERAGECIAACVLFGIDNALRMPYLGFASADLLEIDGASAAIYLFSLQYAFENDFRALDCCGSRPLLDDGVYRTKRGWGAFVHDDWALESLLFKFNNFGDGVRAFLAKNPMIVRHDDELVGKVFVAGEEVGETLLRQIIHRSANPGIDRHHVYCANGFSDAATLLTDSSSESVKLFDLQDAHDPLAVFCDA